MWEGRFFISKQTEKEEAIQTNCRIYGFMGIRPAVTHE